VAVRGAPAARWRDVLGRPQGLLDGQRPARAAALLRLLPRLAAPPRRRAPRRDAAAAPPAGPARGEAGGVAHARAPAGAASRSATGCVRTGNHDVRSPRSGT